MTFSLLTAKQFNSSLNTLSANQKKADELIHALACNAIYHSVLNGQVTPANQLLSRLGKAARKNHLISWMLTYGNFSYDSKEKVMKYKSLFAQGETNAKEQANAAFASPFWDEVADSQVIKPLDIKVALSRFIKAERSKADKTKKAGVNVSHLELLDQLVEFVK